MPMKDVKATYGENSKDEPGVKNTVANEYEGLPKGVTRRYGERNTFKLLNVILTSYQNDEDIGDYLFEQ